MQPNKDEEEEEKWHQDSESFGHLPWNALLPLDSLENTHESLLIQLTRHLLSESSLQAPLSTSQQHWLQWMVLICLWFVSVIWLLLKSQRRVSLSSHPVVLAEGPVGSKCATNTGRELTLFWVFLVLWALYAAPFVPCLTLLIDNLGGEIAIAPWYYSTKNCRCERKKNT